MTERKLPRYPIYVLSKARWRTPLTAKFLLRDEVPFRLVVEPAEEEAYRTHIPDAELLILPRDNMGAPPVRAWIMEHSTLAGDARHWQLDDNIFDVRRLYRGKRIPCNSALGFRVCEDFTDRYTNIGLSGLNYQMFVTDETAVPFYLNVHVYSCLLINNATNARWRLKLNDDTDFALQVLAGGGCTVLINVFMAHKLRTMVMKGGQGQLYHGDGRLRMARTLERAWPYVVTTQRRFQRPQHVIRDAWRGFDTPLIRRDDIDWDNLPAVDEYGADLVQVTDEIRSPIVRDLYDHWHAEH
jgi:hypothetical protein